MSVDDGAGSVSRGNEDLLLPCLLCGQQEQCQKLFPEKEPQVTSSFCKLLRINYLDTRELIFQDSYYCPTCIQELMLVYRLQTELEEINTKLNLLKSECIRKFKEFELILEEIIDPDPLKSCQEEKRRKLCNYITNEGHPPLERTAAAKIKEESYEDDYMDPLSVVETHEPDWAPPSENDDFLRENLDIPRKVRTRQKQKQKPTTRLPRNCKKTKKATATAAAKAVKCLSRRTDKLLPQTQSILNEANQVEFVRSVRARARKDYSQLFGGSEEESGSESSSGSEPENEGVPKEQQRPGLPQDHYIESRRVEADGEPSYAGCSTPPEGDGGSFTSDVIISQDNQKDKNEVASSYASINVVDLSVRVRKLPDDDPRILASKEMWEIKVGVSKTGLERYFCPLKWCKKGFKEPLMLKFHYRQFHMQMAEPYECQECWTSFSTKEEYEQHKEQEILRQDQREGQLEERTNAPPIFKPSYSCDECGRKFGKRRDLKSHMETHASDKYEVQEKPRRIRQRNKKSYRCSVENCNARFWKEVSLQAHVAMVHEGVEHPFVCLVCQRGFKLYRELKYHRVIHSNEKPFKCSQCDERFALRRHRQYHEKISHKPKAFQCDTCGVAFAFMSRLRMHQVIHSDAQPFVCEVCGLSFKRNLQLQRHLPDHPELNLPKNICPYCGKLFSSPVSLKNHEKSHTGDGMLKCTQCDYTAPSRTLIQLHMVSHTTERNYECDICSKKFKTEIAVKRHKEASHAESRDHICKECGKGFFTSIRLRIHFFETHQSRTYSCPFCASTYSRKANLSRHVKACHPGEDRLKPLKRGRRSKSEARHAFVEQTPANLSATSHPPATYAPKKETTSTSMNLPFTQPPEYFPNQDCSRSEDRHLTLLDRGHPTPFPFPDFHRLV